LKKKFLVLAAAACLAFAPAQMASADSTGDYCQYVVTEATNTTQSNTISENCFATIEELQSAGTPDNMFLLADMFDGSWGGAWFEIYGPKLCSAGGRYDMPAIWSRWNNRVSSIMGYAYCYAKFYDIDYFRGDTYICAINCDSIGALNNRTTSFRLWNYFPP
jgi:hypothetical protein